MKQIRVFATLFCLGLLSLAFQPSAKGSKWNRKTIVTLSAPIEVPGVEGKKVVGPGTFVFKIMDNSANRNIVEISTPAATRFSKSSTWRRAQMLSSTRRPAE